MKTIFFWLAMGLATQMPAQVTTRRLANLKDAWNEPVTYVGEVVNDKPNGLGLFIYDNGHALRYAGQFANGLPHGKGTLLFKDGMVLTGNWQQGKMQGKGVNLNKDGDFYLGEFEAGKKQGQGVHVFKDNGILLGSMVQDVYEGRCIFINANGDVISDNLYAGGKKNGAGYQYESATKKLFKGEWENGVWKRANEGSYRTFLTSTHFFCEKNTEKLMMGIARTDGKLEDTCFIKTIAKRQRSFGRYNDGMIQRGLFIRDDSTRFYGNFSPKGSQGTGYSYKVAKYLEVGNYTDDYLAGPDNTYINLAKQTIYQGSTVDKLVFTGKAWYSTQINELFIGDYKEGKFTGQGWKLCEDGLCVRGEWLNGKPTSITGVTDANGKPMSLKPATLSQALEGISKMQPSGFKDFEKEALDDYYPDDYADAYEAAYTVPKSLQNLILTDYGGGKLYVATMFFSDNYGAGVKAYENLCKQLQSLSLTPAGMIKPAKLEAVDKTTLLIHRDDEKAQTASFETAPAMPARFSEFQVHVAFRWRSIHRKYEVMLFVGNLADAEDASLEAF